MANGDRALLRQPETGTGTKCCEETAERLFRAGKYPAPGASMDIETGRYLPLIAPAQEHSYEQIARTLDCPVGTVRSRVNRARVMLRRHLNARTSHD